MREILSLGKASNAQEFAAAVAMPPESSDQTASPWKKIHARLRGRYRWAIALGIMGAAAGGGASLFFVKPLYQSHGLIGINPVVSKMMYETEQTSVMPMFDAFVSTQVELIRSERVILHALEDDDWRAKRPGMTPEDQEDFTDNLEVMRPARANIVKVSVKDEDPDAARIAVRSVIKSYQRLFVEADKKRDIERLQQLDIRSSNLTNKLRALHKQIHTVSQEMGPDAQRQMYEWQLLKLDDMADKIHTVAKVLDEMGPDALDVVDEPEDKEPSMRDRVKKDKHLADLVHLKQQWETQLRMHKIKNRGENHPSVKEAQAALKDANAAIKGYLEVIEQEGADEEQKRGLKLEEMSPKQLNDQLTSLKDLEIKAEKSLKKMRNRIVRIEDLELEAMELQKRLKSTTDRIDALNVESKVSGRIEIITDGERPLTPVNAGNRTQMTILGCIAGGMIGAGLVLLIGTMDHRLRSSEDAQDSIGQIRVLGILPQLPRDMSNPEHARIAGYCVHHIRTMLQLESPAGPARVITVTSAAPGTGKTSLTHALGLSFAASGSRTLMIDCDLNGGSLTSRLKAIIRRRIGQILQRQGLLTPNQLEEALQHSDMTGNRLGQTLIDMGVLKEEDVAKALNLQEEAQVGLLDALDGEPIEHCVTDTTSPRLSVLPIGGAKAYDLSRLSPGAVRRVIEQAKEHFDVVLLDAGPIPSTVETSMVAAEADQVVMIIARGEQRPAAEKAIGFLDSIGAQIAGVVFNRAAAGDVARSVHALSNMSGQPEGSNPPRGEPIIVQPNDITDPVAAAVAITSHARDERS